MKKTTKLMMLIALVSLSAMVTSCNGDDPKPNRDGDISSQTDPDLVADDLQGNVTGDITLDAATTWTLTGPLAVKAGATLTIEAGTTIFAAAGGTNVYVVIETGAMIMAAGTSANPIKFTSNASSPLNGDWGGILINGLAPISGGGTSTTEVLPLSYGGTDTNDDSGVFKYVILEYTGARINGEKEFNGLTLYAVGADTEINNIVINGGDDDGIEFFGGSVTVDNLLVVNARDDMFDWTQGFTGGGSNWYGIRENGFAAVSEDTRGIEGDGNLDGLAPIQSGQSNPTIDKVTIVNAAALEFADMIKIRRGSSATITNAMIATIGATALFSDLIDFSDSKGMASDNALVTFWYNTDLQTNEDEADIKTQADFDDPADGIQADEMTDATATPNIAVTGATTADFSWTGYSFPTLTPASDLARN
jgi:hypothetical protein